jgi:hypothetical protein
VLNWQFLRSIQSFVDLLDKGENLSQTKEMETQKIKVDIKRTQDAIYRKVTTFGEHFERELAKPGDLVDFSFLPKAKFSVFRDSVAVEARKRLSKTRFFKIFVLVSSLMALAEPFLVGYRPVGVTYQLQVTILTASSATFSLDIIMTAIFYQSPSAGSGEARLTPLQIVLAIFETEVILDAVCLIFGWCTIFTYPGLAALRCLRVFRMLFYFELFRENRPSEGASHKLFSLQKASQLCLVYMKKIVQEVFTQESKGGIVIIAMWLYVSYLVAVVFWTQLHFLESSGDLNCSRLDTCFITMVRLSFYDGNGFDWLQALVTTGYGGYALICFLYMIASAIVLLNGLIGIFGGAFSVADDERKLVEMSNSNNTNSTTNPETATNINEDHNLRSITEENINNAHQGGDMMMAPDDDHEEKSIHSSQQSGLPPTGGSVTPYRMIQMRSFLGKGVSVAPMSLSQNNSQSNLFQQQQQQQQQTTAELLSVINLLRQEVRQLNEKVSDLQTTVTRGMAKSALIGAEE